MTFFNDTYCQLCGRFITKEQWNKHILLVDFYLEREVYVNSTAYFPQRTLTRDDCSKLEKPFSKNIFATRGIKEMDEFSITHFIMVTTLND